MLGSGSSVCFRPDVLGKVVEPCVEALGPGHIDAVNRYRDPGAAGPIVVLGGDAADSDIETIGNARYCRW